MQNEKKFELTKVGLEKLKEEREHLITVRRPEVIEKLKEARSFGDLSENSEYDAAKDEQAQVEARIIEVEHIINNVKLIKIEGSKKDAEHRRVRLGRTVDIEDLDTKKKSTLTIVGTLEANPIEQMISNESPLAVAMIGKKEGEIFKFESPSKIREIKIVKIHTNEEQ